MSNLKTPDKIIIQSSERYEELLPEQESFADWYQACKSTWNQNLDQGNVLFIQLAFMEESMIEQSPVEITFFYEEGVIWSMEGRPLELEGLIYSFFPVGGECAAITEDGKYSKEAFVVPFVPTSGLNEMITDWLEQ